MPIEKKDQKKYGMIVGHMINSGKSKEEAKNIADKAVDVKQSKGKCKVCGKKHEGNWHS